MYCKEAKDLESSCKPFLKWRRQNISVGIIWVLGMVVGSLVLLPPSLPFFWIFNFWFSLRWALLFLIFQVLGR